MEIESVWRDNQDKLFLFIRSKVANECDAKDLLHQVYLKAHERHGTLKDLKKARSWLYQVTRNAIVDYYRSHKRMAELPEDLRAPVKEENAWGLISRCVRPFIEELPKLYREALVLSEIEGLDHAHVAKRLKISLSSAKARVLRGRLKLKKKFDDCCIFECGPRGAKIHSDTFGKEE
ncbi:MAG: sigma-70 family RNA polymerase sigma factor [Candidatus Omnitrophica bacterium]|nr:sigma-70 family RNA polymerase sigma factor [Candidatus Omnitrophota bacterium]